MTKEACSVAHEELFTAIDSRIVACKGDIADELHTMNATLTAFSKAFPHTEGGDPDFGGHRMYHESLIKAARAEEKFWTDLRHDLLKKGIFWAIVIAFGLIAVGIQVKLGLVKLTG